jgi:hypothetical protein
MKEPKRLAFHEDVQLVNKKLDLILNHLKLEYVPETEKKEPAKLVQKCGDVECTSNTLLAELGSYRWQNFTEPKKKKTGRPKKK